tara:strand:+ start:100 stop:492 length:393 start_codon:yes stop_codon:yes gene_type:complete
MKDIAIKERIHNVVDSIGGNSSEMARRIGIKPTYLAAVMNSRDKGISSTLLKGFANAGVNLHWLVTGQSEMWTNGVERETVKSLKEKVVEIQEKLEVAEIKLGKLSFYIKQLERLLNIKDDDGKKSTFKY